MELKTYQENNATIIEITGHLDTMTSPEYEKQMNKIVEGGCNVLIVDCTKLDYISSSGLRVLLMTLKTISNKGGKLVLFGMQEAVFEVFKICRFDSLFTITKDKAAALQAVAS